MSFSNAACHGPCNNAARKAWADYGQALDDYVKLLDAWILDGQRGDCPPEPLPPADPPTPGDPLFCGRCKERVRQALVDLDQLAAQLQAQADGHRGLQTDGRVSGSRTSRSPSPSADLLDKLYGFLADTEDEWRQTWGYTPRVDRAHRGAHPRSRRITWLAERLEGILAAEDHVSFGLAVLNWEIVLRNHAKEDPVGTRSPIRCPRSGCQERRVVRQKAGYWQCGSCSMVVSDPVERRLRHEQGVELQAAESAQLVS